MRWTRACRRSYKTQRKRQNKRDLAERRQKSSAKSWVHSLTSIFVKNMDDKDLQRFLPQKSSNAETEQITQTLDATIRPGATLGSTQKQSPCVSL